MFIVPLEVLLSWPVPNYIDPETRGQAISIVSLLFISVATIFVWGRLYQRIFVRRWFGPDDLFIVLGWIFAVGVSACTVIGNKTYSWNHHVWDMPVRDFQPSLELVYFARIFWGLSTSWIRLSVLCLYYRLLRASDAPNHFFVVLHATTAVTIIIMLYYFMSGVVPCVPIRAYWVWPPMIGESSCFNDSISLQASAVVNTVIELWVATMPLLATFHLQVDPKQRWPVINVLCLGYIVCIAGCFRTFYIWKVIDSYDYTWWSGPQWIASEIEIDSALICACAVPLRPMAIRIARRVSGAEDPDSPRRRSTMQRRPTMKDQSSVLNSQVSNFSHDHEAINEWRTAMSRTIDLEGIANDGFGYSVTISGPISPNPGKKQKNKNKDKKTKPFSGIRFPWSGRRILCETTDNSHSSQSGLGYSRKTEVSVQKTWSTPSYDEGGLPSGTTTQLAESRFNSVCPKELDDMTFESMGLHMNGLLTDTTTPTTTTTITRPQQAQQPQRGKSRWERSHDPRRASQTPLNFPDPPHQTHDGPTHLYIYDSDEQEDDDDDDDDVQALPSVRPPSGRYSADGQGTRDIRNISWFGDPPPPARKFGSR